MISAIQHFLGMTTTRVDVHRYLKLCQSLRQSAQHEQAGQVCEQALLQWPNHAALWLQRCELYEDQQQWAAALHGRLHLARLCPHDYANLSEVADLYQRLGDFESSVVYYTQAQSLAPQHPVVANNLGNALQLVHRYEEALTHYQRATAFDPNYFDAWHNCAVTLRRLERMTEAQQAAEHSLKLSPQHPKAVWNLALLKLLLGDYEAGWPLYEARWQNPELGLRHPDFSEPALLDASHVAGQHVFVWSEQGLGDTLQMLRYLPLLLAQGATVSLAVPTHLHRLVHAMALNVAVYPTGERPAQFDVHCPVMTLPLVFNTSLATIPSGHAYLKVPQDAQTTSSVCLSTQPHRMNVGLVWSGRAAHKNDHNRSVPLEQLLPLLALDDVQFWSLQKEYRAADQMLLDQLSGRVMDVSHALHDMADTAALIAQMDVVISVDTSVAHLAAALGKPVWLMLPTDPDFRWLLGREDTPWYPTMTLCRQTTPGQWRDVIHKLKQQLQELRQNHETHANI